MITKKKQIKKKKIEIKIIRYRPGSRVKGNSDSRNKNKIKKQETVKTVEKCLRAKFSARAKVTNSAKVSSCKSIFV